MRNTKLATAIGAAMLPGLAFAVPPQFGEWSVTGGDVDPCAALTNVESCEVMVFDSGFVQAQLKGTDGKTYIKSIVTDQDATGTPAGGDLAFYDENFVRITFSSQTSSVPGGAGSDPGFMGKQVILDTTTSSVTKFSSETEIRTGWGETELGGPNVAINTTIATIDGAGDPNGLFESVFDFQGNNDPDTGQQTGTRLNIDQNVSLSTDAATDDDRQVFAFRSRTGDLLNSNGVWGSSTDDATIDDPFDGIGGPESVPWVEGGTISAFWIGQNVATPGVGGGASEFFAIQVGPAFSQAGTGFPNTDGTALGGFQDWATDAELTEFGPPPTL